MGRSYTYHVIGFASIDENTEAAYPAMNRVEMVQETIKAKRRDGHIITSWIAQTRTGYKMLGGWSAHADDVPKPKLVQCPICKGAGCCICNQSGVCKPGHWLKWTEWQRERIAAEVQP